MLTFSFFATAGRQVRSKHAGAGPEGGGAELGGKEARTARRVPTVGLAVSAGRRDA